jgi:hypothetical protein
MTVQLSVPDDSDDDAGDGCPDTSGRPMYPAPE